MYTRRSCFTAPCPQRISQFERNSSRLPAEPALTIRRWPSATSQRLRACATCTVAPNEAATIGQH